MYTCKSFQAIFIFETHQLASNNANINIKTHFIKSISKYDNNKNMSGKYVF